MSGIKIQDLFKKEKNPQKLPSFVDPQIWIRSCKKEILEPIEGVLTGKIPKWLNGKLLMNGPGKYYFGDRRLSHMFDGMALIQKFTIKDGKVTYQNKFLESKAYKQNTESGDINFAEFGTAAESLGIIERILSFGKLNLSDNTVVSIYPICDSIFTLTELPLVHKINHDNLEILERTRIRKPCDMQILSAHPHVMADGSVYNVGQTINGYGAYYNVIYYPKGEKDINNAKLIAKIPSRFRYHPTYIHSFGITENFIIIYESPFVMSVMNLTKSLIIPTPFSKCLKWLNDEETRIILIDRNTGELAHSFYTDPFFCFHDINGYEKNNQVILDLCCFENGEVVDGANLDNIINTPDKFDKFKTRPLRFILPLKTEAKNTNLVKFGDTTATATFDGRKVFCTPEVLYDIDFEFPRVNYPKFNATEYQYFYGVCTTLNENLLGGIFKVDVKNKTMSYWKEGKIFAYEPIFVPSPNPQSEDDGLIVTGFLTNNEENRVGIIILDARNMKEIAKCEFVNLPSAISKPFHGWWVNDGEYEN